MNNEIRFRDGSAYDRMMGGWSRLVGDQFLDWIGAGTGLDWLDIGCGSGAFSALIAERRAPKSILGFDPSEAQLEYARSRGLDSIARFLTGDAMSLSFADKSVDVAAAALVMHFIPDPVPAIVTLSRAVRPGGLIAAYSWDLSGGGFPYAAVNAAVVDAGLQITDPPRPDAADPEALRTVWVDAGLRDIAQRDFTVELPFTSDDDYWQAATSSGRFAALLADTSPKVVEAIKADALSRLPRRSDGALLPSARANAIMGRVIS